MWVYENGFDVLEMIREIPGHRLAVFVLIGFVLHDGKRLEMRSLWVPILATMVIGVSLGLPLFYC